MTQPTREAANLELVHRYLRALEGGAIGDALAAFMHQDVVQHEQPNRIVPRGARHNLAEMLAGAERGKKNVASQRYDVRSAIAQGDTVAVELDWTGTLAVPLGPLQAGHELRAHIALFLKLRDGRIASLRNYDCYEPF
jgi:ketosteroid isomerase-like protein